MNPVEKELYNLTNIPEEFISAVEVANKKVFDSVLKLLSELEQKYGYIIPNKASLQKIELIAEQIRTTLLEGDYVKALTEYTKTFEAHGQVVLETFDIGAKLSDNPFYKDLIKQTQRNVLELFDASAIEFQLVSPIKDILTNSISSSMKFSDAVKSIRDFIEGSDTVEPRLLKYANVYARDAFSIFDRSFTQVVNKEYDIKYWEYAGGIVKGTREFCKNKVGKAFTDDEVRSWAKDDWQGKNSNTTAQSIFTYLGGYNCMHVLLPISKERYEKLK